MKYHSEVMKHKRKCWILRLTFFLWGWGAFSLCSGESGSAWAEAFKMAPYLIKNKDNDYVMKFKLASSQKLSIMSSQISKSGQTKTLATKVEAYKANILHEVNIGRPDCDQQFSYSISAQDRKSDRTLFRNQLPAVPCDPQKELVVGFLADTQQNKGHAEIAQVILKKNEKDKINFIINGGDVVHYGAREKEWLDHFKVAAPYYKSIPVIAALGNHEYWYSYLKRISSALFKKFMRAEDDPNGTELHLEFPQADFIVFNSNFTWMRKDVYQAHLKWLEEALAKAKANNKKAIVIMHHSPFTSGSGNDELEAKTIRKDVIPLLEKAGNVPLVLSGHVHTYERIKKEGIQYLVAGPAGGCKYKISAKHPFSEFINDKERTFSMLKINQSRLRIETYNKRGQLIDQMDLPLK